MASPLRHRLAELEQQLVEERAHHDQSRGQLEQAQRVLAELQARVQRVALDHDDELTAERQASMQVQRELDDLLFERNRLINDTPSAAVKSEADPQPMTLLLEPTTTPAPANAPSRKPRDRLRLHPLPEPKPVRWWTASYRAQAKGKR